MSPSENEIGRASVPATSTSVGRAAVCAVLGALAALLILGIATTQI